VTETQRLEPPTEDFAGLYRPTTPPPPPPRPAKPPVDWGRRCKAALFVLLVLADLYLIGFGWILFIYARSNS
jgi:hypothetical protein